MNSYHKLDIVKDSLLFILDFLRDNVHLIPIGFAADATVRFNDELRDSSRIDFRSAVTNLRTKLHTNLSSSKNRIVNFLFTDGVPNKGITDIEAWTKFLDNRLEKDSYLHPFLLWSWRQCSFKKRH